MTKITSKDNPAVRLAIRLMSSARERRRSGMIICEGARLCGDAAESGVAIDKLFCTAASLDKYSDYLEGLIRNANEAYEITDEIARKISDTENTQGVFIIAKMPAVENDLTMLKPTGQYVLLENLQDPSNVGAIFRTAEAFGLDGIILTDGCASCFSPKALRAGMGAMFRIPVFLSCDAPSDMAAAAERNMRPMAAVPREGAANVTGIRFFRGAVMCIGNEGNGLSQALISACPEKITIPMNGRAESLNAATAAAILMWEMVRGYIAL